MGQSSVCPQEPKREPEGRLMEQVEVFSCGYRKVMELGEIGISHLERVGQLLGWMWYDEKLH